VSGAGLSPIELLQALAVQEKELVPGLRHLEIYTMEGLLTLLWHGPRDATQVALLCGGGMGGLLGPADGLYHDLGVALAEQGIATIRVDYRRPNRFESCVLDVAAAADFASQRGATRFVTVGHSFGGAVALNVGLALPSAVVGVALLATQSAGCENAAGLGGRPFILFHGEEDEVLPPETSDVVAAIAGYGEVVRLPGDGHLLSQSAGLLRARLGEWIPAVLAVPPAAEEQTTTNKESSTDG
jgi:pimeloyl-ACP methyl ester carboxylesterase